MGQAQSNRIAVVILNWNGRHLLERFLPSVEAFSAEADSIVVADNASTDDSLDYLRERHPRVETLVLDRNYGFAAGYNRALRQVKADYYVLLNSDVEVTEGWLTPLLEIMCREPKVAACMPKIRSESCRSRFEHAGAAGGFIDQYGYTFCRGRLFDTVEEDCGQYDTEREVFWATGACCMVRAAAFHALAGFDEHFFAHMEEIDLCWRWRNAGYSVWYTPRSTVYHLGGGMLPSSSPFKAFLNYRNNLLMLYKNLPRRQHRRVLLVRLFLDYLSGFYDLLKGKGTILSICKARRDYRKLRRNYQPTLPADYPSCVYRGSLVWQYFARRRKTFEKIIPQKLLRP